MAFPDTPLPIEVAFNIDGTWTDVTSDVRASNQVNITRGRSSWAQSVDPGRCSFSLSNNDGKYSPRNPAGPYYGAIGRNTPVRVSVNTGETTLWCPALSDDDYAYVPDSAAIDITGDLDVRFEAELSNWHLSDRAVGDGTQNRLTLFIGRYNENTNDRSWMLYQQYGKLRFYWSEDGTSSTGYIATPTEQLVVPASGRMAIRVTIDVDTGTSDAHVTFYTADTIDGPWKQHGEVLTVGHTTSINAGSTQLRIGKASINGSITTGWWPALGHIYKAEVRNGIDGTAVANPDFTVQTPGATSFVDGAGRTWTLNGQTEITNRKVRFVGEVSSWTPQWDTGGFDVVCNVEASGILRRLTQGVIAAKSPMYREFTNPARTGIVAYWPMEDAQDATAFASGFADHPAMTYTATVTPASYTDWVASDPLPTVTSGQIIANIPAYTATTHMSLRAFVAIPAAGVVSTQRLVTILTSGTTRRWTLSVDTSGQLSLRGYNADSAQVYLNSLTTVGINGMKASVGVGLTQSGSDISVTIFVYDCGVNNYSTSSAYSTTTTLSGYTFGSATGLRFGDDGAMNGTAIGHVAVANVSTAFASTAGALTAWVGEYATSRFHRFGYEEGFYSFSTSIGAETMGAQALDTIANLQTACADVDEGIMCELRYLLGTKLVHLGGMYNAPVVFTMDYTGDDGLVAPLDPVDDDQSVTNDVTVQRSSGSSARVMEDSGPLSTAPPPDGIGLYDTSYTLNLYTDDQPLQHASWRLHLGTWDETRYPQVVVNLAGAPGSIEVASLIDVGTRMQITNPPSWLPPGTIDLVVQGYTEVMDQYTWTITYNCTPYSPLEVGVVGSETTADANPTFAWADTSGSELVVALNTTDTSVRVFTSDGPTWTDNPSDMPFAWRMGGEVVHVASPDGLLGLNPFFTANTTGWTAFNATISRSTAQVISHPLAVASLHVIPNGTSASGGANGTVTAAGTVQPGVTYQALMWVYSPTGWSDLSPAVDWYDATSTYLSTSWSSTAVAAGVWTLLSFPFTAPANASRASLRARFGSTPSSSNDFYVWGLRLARPSASWIKDNFGRTASGSWGTADSGQAWSIGGGTTADFNVTGGFGVHRLSTTGDARRTFTSFNSLDSDVYVSMTTSATATGASMFGGLASRYIDADNLYTARVEFSTANVVTLTIRKRVAAVDTQLGTYTTPIAYTAGTMVRIRFQVIGSSLKAKCWLASQSEPIDWHIEVTDTTWSVSSYTGFRSISTSGNTNTNPEIRYDNYEMTNPQTYTVIRSANGVVKSQAAGEAISLANPARVAL